MTILQQYTNLAEKHDLPAMTAGGCDIEIHQHESAEAAWQALVAAKPTAGWFQCQSKQQSFTGALPAHQPDWGALLAAEVAATDGSSLRIEYQNGLWWETCYHHRNEGDLLCDEVRQFLHSGGRLVYRRYWRHDPEQGWVQSHACLVAIEPLEK